MNVLLTAAGRRSYLVKYFREALNGRGIVVCANCDPLAPAMQAADKSIAVPRSDHPEYPRSIFELCRRFDIRLLSSLHDLDLFVLSQHRERIRACNTVPVLPNIESATIALDKYALNLRLEQFDISIPWSTLELTEAEEALAEDLIRLPLIVKHRMGFGSQGLFECKNLDDLHYAYGRINNLGDLSSQFYRPSLYPERFALIQEKVQGTEFCLGLISDLDGRLVGHTRTEIHSMRAGESDTATTRDASPDMEMASQLGELLKVPGFCSIDWIQSNGQAYVIDINPRFTGDYPFCHLAGANVPAALIAWRRAENVSPDWLVCKPDVSGYKELVPRLADDSQPL